MKLANSRLLDLVFVMAQRGSSLAQLLRKIADANSVVLLKPLCASSVARKERRAGSLRVTLANTARLPLYRNSLID